jgi:hypothetical protein
VRARRFEGESSDSIATVFEGVTLTREQGTAVLVGAVRDQAGPQGPLQHASALGLTLLEAAVAERNAKR